MFSSRYIASWVKKFLAPHNLSLALASHIDLADMAVLSRKHRVCPINLLLSTVAHWHVQGYSLQEAMHTCMEAAFP